MQHLALVLFAPWFAVLGWLFWSYPRTHAVTPARRRFDVAALLVSAAATGLAVRWTYLMPFQDSGAMWPQVLATLVAYHAFVLVIAIAWLWRGRLFGSR